MTTDMDGSQAQSGGELSKDERMWGMLCHVAGFGYYVVPIVGGIVGPMIVWMLKKDEYPFVDDQGKESLNFQITIAIVMSVIIALCFALIGFLLLPLLPIIGLAQVVLTIIGSMQANNGVWYRYPFAIRLIK
jgi:uncharacterized Tic20 family protein